MGDKPVWADITREIAYHFWRALEGDKKTPSEVLEAAAIVHKNLRVDGSAMLHRRDI